MTFEGIIATPFGYLLDGLYRLTSNYGVALMLFAVAVQLVMVPLSIKHKYERAKKARLHPAVLQIKKDYCDDANKQADLIAELYKKEHYSIVGTFILGIIPFFILIPIFQVAAQPITYMFHETPETAAAIIAAMREEAPELFTGSYHQIMAIANINEYAEAVKAAVPEVSARTLEGLDYSFLGLDLTCVPGSFVIGKAAWAWDWVHVGAILFPIVYMGRRIYMLVANIVRTYSNHNKAKKAAKAAGEPEPKLPNPPVVSLFFLFLSLTAMSSIPIAMNLYWLTSGFASTGLNMLAVKILEKKTSKTTQTTTAENAL